MAFDFHSNRTKYFEIQRANSQETILPLVDKFVEVKEGMQVLEIGCRDGGVLSPFYDKGCYITGLDISKSSLETARRNYDPARSEFIFEDAHVYASEATNKKFDVIILKDTIEHIPNQEILIQNLHKLLAKDGVIYFGFPPWQNPYGGHQQVCSNKLCAIVPYYHLLPNFIYLNIIKLLSPKNHDWLKITKETRISPESFERFVKKSPLKILKREFYLISPAYKYKFNLKPRKQFPVISAIPYFRNFLTTTCDYIIGWQ